MCFFRFSPANYTLSTLQHLFVTSSSLKAQVSARTDLYAGTLSHSHTSSQQQMDGLEAEPGRRACGLELPTEC